MVSKCANPGCIADFRYLHEGKLFHVEVDTAIAIFPPATHLKKPARRTEFFWLCDECATKVTLTVQKGIGVTVKPLVRALAASS